MEPEIIPSQPRTETPKPELAKAIRRLIKQGWSIKKIAEMTCRSELSIKKLLKEYPE